VSLTKKESVLNWLQVIAIGAAQQAPLIDGKMDFGDFEDKVSETPKINRDEVGHGIKLALSDPNFAFCPFEKYKKNGPMS
jgi:hypothetical protein